MGGVKINIKECNLKATFIRRICQNEWELRGLLGPKKSSRLRGRKLTPWGATH